VDLRITEVNVRKTIVSVLPAIVVFSVRYLTEIVRTSNSSFQISLKKWSEIGSRKIDRYRPFRKSGRVISLICSK